MSASLPSRRRMLRTTAALGAGLALGPLTRAEEAKTVKVGILHSLTGVLGEVETPLRDAELLAIEEINKAGGVLGRTITPVVEDGKSDFLEEFPRKAKKLITEDRVAVLFGLYTSVSRRTCLPTLEENHALLFYPAAFEGNEDKKQFVYVGPVPNQVAFPALDWALGKDGGSKRKIYLLGSDYIYPRTINLLLTHQLKGKQLKPVRETHVPFGNRDFKKVVQEIRDTGADLVVSSLLGDSHRLFFDELAAQGATPDKTTVLSLSLDEDDLRVLDPAKVKGHLAAATYFQSLPAESNQKFVKAFQARYGKERVTTATLAAAYTQVYLWKLAAEKAKSFDVDKVRSALGGLEYEGPAGKIKVGTDQLFTAQRCRIGRITPRRQFEVVFETTEAIAPVPYPEPLGPGR